MQLDETWQDTWVAVDFDEHDRVYTVTRYFPDGTDEDFAMFLLTRQDLPPDAAQTFSKDGGLCKILGYSSPTLASHFDGLGVIVALDSGPDEVYRPGRIEAATLLLGDKDDESIEC